MSLNQNTIHKAPSTCQEIRALFELVLLQSYSRYPIDFLQNNFQWDLQDPLKDEPILYCIKLQKQQELPNPSKMSNTVRRE